MRKGRMCPGLRRDIVDGVVGHVQHLRCVLLMFTCSVSDLPSTVSKIRCEVEVKVNGALVYHVRFKSIGAVRICALP